MLGVHCQTPYVEEVAASTVTDYYGGTIEPGWAISQMIEVAFGAHSSSSVNVARTPSISTSMRRLTQFLPAGFRLRLYTGTREQSTQRGYAERRPRARARASSLPTRLVSGRVTTT